MKSTKVKSKRMLNKNKLRDIRILKVKLCFFILLYCFIIISLYVTHKDELIHIYYEEPKEQVVSITEDDVKRIVEEAIREYDITKEKEVEVNNTKSIDSSVSSRSGNDRASNIQKTSLGKFRMTSYYNGDNCASTNVTGTGLKTSDFQVNEKGWYTYKGKLVLAGATKELKKTGYSTRGAQKSQNKYYFSYYEEVTIVFCDIIIYYSFWWHKE